MVLESHQAVIFDPLFKRSSRLKIHKKRPAFYGRLSRNLKLYCCCHGAGCLPVTLLQPAKSRAYLQIAVGWNALSLRKDSPPNNLRAKHFKGQCVISGQKKAHSASRQPDANSMHAVSKSTEDIVLQYTFHRIIRRLALKL